MTVQSLTADVLDALVSTWTNSAALAAYNTTGVRLAVFDGPPITDRAAEIEVWVGATGLAPDETVINGTQDWVTLGDAADDRDESIDIKCAIWVAATTNSIGTTRRTALNVFNDAITAVRGSDLGIAALDPTVAPVAWEMHQGQFSSGPAVVITFTIRATGML